MNESVELKEPALTGGRVLARNTIINLAGSLVPLLVAFLAIPALIGNLGTERFGVLTLIWLAVGYFSLFDLGVGRATTKFVAENLARRETDALPKLVWSSLGMLFALGLAGALLLALVNPLLVSHLFNIPAGLRAEATRSFYLIAAALPWVLGSAGLRGVLEAQQRFIAINLVRIPVSSLLYAAPLLVSLTAPDLYPITVALLGMRLLEFGSYACLCLGSVPGLRQPRWPGRAYVRQLLGFGGWLTVTNIVGPLMTYLDRFLIGGLLSMSAVAYYATPYDFVARLAVIPGSLLCVMFPALSASFSTDGPRFVALYRKTLGCVVLVMTPVCLALAAVAHPFLNAWIGPKFAAQSTPVFRILAVATLVNAIGQVPYSALQAMGRPDLTAKLHLLELPLYLMLLWTLARNLGIGGVALAYLARVVIDTCVLHRLAQWMIPRNRVSGEAATRSALAAAAVGIFK
ncbi:polysaccharide biosynthesis protein [Geomonas silvestris]|uniref:Polysaccharide biosynthesis protein n=1 Tax=Geomonas silvestris TaxID=2740184 RepID=A0A6V8MI70_9BACT|nr:flippase [Geomonas silvestris]GFO59672.1 polysaccharide biosynthesis protein [Geomonas silvestris]